MVAHSAQGCGTAKASLLIHLLLFLMRVHIWNTAHVVDHGLMELVANSAYGLTIIQLYFIVRSLFEKQTESRLCRFSTHDLSRPGNFDDTGISIKRSPSDSNDTTSRDCPICT